MIVPLWIVFALLTVASRAVSKPYQKYLLEDFEESELLVVRDSVALIFFIPTVLYLLCTSGFSGTAESTAAMLGSGFLNLIGAFVVFASLNRGDASLVVPIMSFSPVVTALIEPFLREAVIPPTVIFGGVLCSVGAVITSSKGNSVRNLFEESDKVAIILAVSANFIFGLTSILDAISTSVINPFISSSVIVLFVWSGSLLRMVYFGSKNSDERKSRLLRMLRRDKGILGILQFVGLSLTFLTFSTSPSAAQASVLFKLSIVFVVIFGYLKLDEGYFVRRLLGAVMISVGSSLAVI